MNSQEQFKIKIGKFDLICCYQNHSIKFRAECLNEGIILESTFSNDSLPLECKIFFSQSITKLYNFIKEKPTTKLKMQNDELHIMFDLMGQKKNITLPLQKGQADLKSLLTQIQKLNKTVQGLKEQKTALTKQLENTKHQFAAYRATQSIQHNKTLEQNSSLKSKNKLLQKQLDSALQKEKKLKNQLQQKQKEIKDNKQTLKKQKTLNKKKQKQEKKAEKQKIKKDQKIKQRQIQQSMAKEQQRKQSSHTGFSTFLNFFNRPMYQQPRQYVYSYQPQSEQQVQVEDQSSQESQQQFDSEDYENQYEQPVKKKTNKKSKNKKKQKLAMDLAKDQFIIKWAKKNDIIQKIMNLSRYPDCLTIKIKGTQSQNANQGIKELTEILQNDVSLKHVFLLNIYFDNIPFTKGVDHMAWDLLREAIIQHGQIKYINLTIGSKTWSANEKQLARQMQVYPKNLILTLYVETWQ